MLVSQRRSAWGEIRFLPLHPAVTIYRQNIEYGVGLWIRKGSDYPQSTGGFIHGELTLSRIASVVVGILGAGSSNTQTQPRAETAKRMPRGAPSDGKVRSGTSTGRCKFTALLVLTLRGRLVRVAFGL